MAGDEPSRGVTHVGGDPTHARAEKNAWIAVRFRFVDLFAANNSAKRLRTSCLSHNVDRVSETLAADLTPRSPDWGIRVALEARAFFAPLGPTRERAMAVLDRQEPLQNLILFDVYDFMTYLSKTGWPDQNPHITEIYRILRQMASAGLLMEGMGTVPINGNRFATYAHITQAQSDGLLWLAPVLGTAFIVPAIGSLTVPVAGVSHLQSEAPAAAESENSGSADLVALASDQVEDLTSVPCQPWQQGDREHVLNCRYVKHNLGSGLLVSPDHVLTCKHVVEGMVVLDEQEDSAQRAPLSEGFSPSGKMRVLKIDPHPTEDVAIITIDRIESEMPEPRGIAFRDPVYGDKVTVFGYPRVTQSKAADLIVQTGEVVHPNINFSDPNTPVGFLFSATTRPGNSGGPIVANDGRIVGMAVQDDATQTAEPGAAPFYAALPTRRIVAALSEIGHPDLLRVEDWNYRPNN